MDVLEDIEKTLGIVPGFMKGIPEDVLTAVWPVFKKYNVEHTGIIPAKYREMIGLAIAAAIKCPYCQLFHREAAKMSGATEEELAELAYLANDTAGWSATIHAQHYDYQKFKEEVEQIGKHLQETMGK